MNFKNSIIYGGADWTPYCDKFTLDMEVSQREAVAASEMNNDNADDMSIMSVINNGTRANKMATPFVTAETIVGIAECGSGLYFTDGNKPVDFVIVYNKYHLNEMQEKRRQYFQTNLIKEGLELESEHPEANSEEGLVFCKIHAPWKTLCRQAERVHLKMPLKLQEQNVELELGKKSWFGRLLQTLTKIRGKVNDSSIDHGSPHDHAIFVHVTMAFSRKKLQRFHVVDKDNFFTPVQRLELVWEILQSTRNDPNDDKSRGVESLLEKHIYESALPLHDGDYEVMTNGDESDTDAWCIRQRLRRTWARWGCALRPQPLELIRKYYGEKIGFYFAFLGFYTEWLVLPAIGGFFSFLYGLFSASKDKIVQQFCDEKEAPGNFTMCPMCQPPNCEPFLMAEEGCQLISWDFRMDNEATLILACLSVIWATVFIKMWKRRESELAYKWDTFDLEHEDVIIRPEYEEQAKEQAENPITRQTEPHVPRSTRILWMCVSVFVTLFLLTCVSAILAGLVLVRIKLYGAYHHLGGTFTHYNVEWSRWTVHGLIFISVVIFEKIYRIVALKLTSWECPKTQSQYVSSFLWKVFLFELVNDFVPIAYAAWFKGRLVDTPLDLDYKSELCDPGGCLAEVVELISVLLLARLIIGNTAEVGIPFMQNVLNACYQKKLSKSSSLSDPDNNPKLPQYRKDFRLNELELDGVAEEYMEMIVQFAFVTLFVPAFPLAALVCFLNNIAEIRVDAINFVTAHRRPLPIRVPGIEIWNQFLDIITKLAIIVNAALIAFTSELLPRLYFKYSEYENYGEFCMSTINMKRFHNEHIDHYIEKTNVTECYYQDYRDHHWPYGRSELWWKIMCVRISGFAFFIVAFFVFHWMFNFLVSDVPAKVDMKIRRRKFVLSKAAEADAVVDKWLDKGSRNNSKK